VEIKGSIKEMFTAPLLDIAMETEIKLEQAAMAAGMKTGVPKGKFRADLSVAGGLDNPEVKLSISSGNVEFQDFKIQNSKFKWVMKDGLVTMLPSSLFSDSGNLSLDGEVNLKKAFPKGFQESFDLNEIFYKVNAALDGVQLSALPGIDFLDRGIVTSKVKFEGRGIDPETLRVDIEAELTATELLARGMGEPVDLTIQVDTGLDGGVARIESVRLATPGLVLTGQGQVDIPGKKVSGRVNLAADDLEVLDRLTNARGKGQVTATAQIDGSLSSPVVSLSLLGSNLEINDIILGDLVLNAGLDNDGQIMVDKIFLESQEGSFHARMGLVNGVLDIETIRLARGNSLISGSGQARIMDASFVPVADPVIQMTLSGDTILLEDFFTDMTGGISIDGQVKGQLSNLDGVFAVKGDSLRIRGQGVDSISSKILFQGRTIKIDQMDIQVAKDSVVKVKGKVLPMDQTFDIQVNSDKFDLTCLELVREKQVDSGLLSLNLNARGSFHDPMVNGELGINEIVIFKKKQNPMDFSVELKNRRIGIKGDIGPEIEGEYFLDTMAFAAALDMDSLDLSPYFKLMGRNQFTGTITGHVRAEGRSDQPEQIRAFADFAKIAVALEGKPFVKVRDANLEFKDGQLYIPLTRIELLEKGSLTVKGRGEPGKTLDFDIKGDIPLEAVASLVKEIESATGQILLNASIKGPVEAPLVNGELVFKGLGMAVEGVEQDLKNIEGSIKLTPEKIEILGFKGYLDEGRFDIGGSVELEKWVARSFDIKFNAHQLSLDIPDLMDLSINCDLGLAGSDQASKLKGEIVLLEGRYYKDVELDLIAAATRKTRKIKPVKENSLPDFLKTIALKVDISRREPLLVDNNLAYLEISPDLTIQGTAAMPVLAGRAMVDSGRINFQRTEFEVKKGVIDFVNPYKIDPLIDIEGEIQIRSWIITLAVSGTPDNLEIKFSSSPPEQHGDILSLIAFGKTNRELRSADGGGRFSPEGIFADMMADSLEKSLKDASGMDYLEIDTSDKDNTGSRGVNVTVGTDLSRQISVKYGVDVRNGETVQRVTTIYKLLENLLMSGYQDTGGKFGGELKYRLEFR